MYTFDFYNDLLDLRAWEARLRLFPAVVKAVPLARYLQGQPLRVLARRLSAPRYAWHLELWHESQLVEQHDEETHQQQGDGHRRGSDCGAQRQQL